MRVAKVVEILKYHQSIMSNFEGHWGPNLVKAEVPPIFLSSSTYESWTVWIIALPPPYDLCRPPDPSSHHHVFTPFQTAAEQTKSNTNFPPSSIVLSPSIHAHFLFTFYTQAEKHQVIYLCALCMTLCISPTVHCDCTTGKVSKYIFKPLYWKHEKQQHKSCLLLNRLLPRSWHRRMLPGPIQSAGIRPETAWVPCTWWTTTRSHFEVGPTLLQEPCHSIGGNHHEGCLSSPCTSWNSLSPALRMVPQEYSSINFFITDNFYCQLDLYTVHVHF